MAADHEWTPPLPAGFLRHTTVATGTSLLGAFILWHRIARGSIDGRRVLGPERSLRPFAFSPAGTSNRAWITQSGGG